MPKVNGMEASVLPSEFPSVPVIVLTGEPELAGATQLFNWALSILGETDFTGKTDSAVHKSVRDHVFRGPFSPHYSRNFLLQSPIRCYDELRVPTLPPPYYGGG